MVHKRDYTRIQCQNGRRSSIYIGPNPFIVRSSYETDDIPIELTFNGLTDQCKIKIYTVTGGWPKEIRHVGDRPEILDLRNENNQEVASGLYMYTIENLTSNNNEPYIGKLLFSR